LFLGIVIVFALITQWTAKVFRLFSPLQAYSLDIGGSCLGILCFMGISWLQLPAWSWFVMLLPVWIFAMPPASPRARWIPAVLLSFITFLVWYQDQSLLNDPDLTDDFEVVWSPYQKVEFARITNERRSIYVNGIGHQELIIPEEIPESFYSIPHRFRVEVAGLTAYENVLIIGAGSGNDVSAALAHGAKHVDAVEIDPAIARFGQLNHLAKPYDDPRVTLIVDDGRAFMARTERRYDLIIFALTDSLVKVSAMAQLRLENYIFTEESIRRAYSLLREDGHLVLYNFYREDWLIARIHKTIEQATGRPPQSLAILRDFHILAVGPNVRAPEGQRHDTSGVMATTDDWPFLYLKNRGIPDLYKVAMLGLASFVAVLLFALQRFTRNLEEKEAGPSRLLLKAAFVLMGLAFLLLETKGIVQFSLLFGTTWKNSSLVFLAALLLVLAANAVAARVRGNALLPVAFILLMVSCLGSLIYPLANLLSVESGVLRFALASLLTFSPIFFANLIFSLVFRDQPVAEHLFGWNLIGTTLGGVFEYTSMWIGYNALAVVVAISYAFAFGLFYAARRLQSD